MRHELTVVRIRAGDVEVSESSRRTHPGRGGSSPMWKQRITKSFSDHMAGIKASSGMNRCSSKQKDPWSACNENI